MSDAPSITTPPLPMVGERLDPIVATVLIYGGSFDPPHKGHVQLPLMAVRHLEHVSKQPRRVWLLYVPASRSPHKAERPTATDHQRMEMIRLATGHLPRVSIWTDELDRAGSQPSYTVDTLARLRRFLDLHGGEDVALRLLIGADQAQTFDRWREPERIYQLARPLVMLRAGEDGKYSAVKDFETLPVARFDASSTMVRAALSSGDDDDSPLKRMLDPQVLAYIRRHGLYGPAPIGG